MFCVAFSLSLSCCRWRRSAWALATVLDVPVAGAKGFKLLLPLKFTFRGRRELPEKVENDMFGGIAVRRSYWGESGLSQHIGYGVIRDLGVTKTTDKGTTQVHVDD